MLPSRGSSGRTMRNVVRRCNQSEWSMTVHDVGVNRPGGPCNPGVRECRSQVCDRSIAVDRSPTALALLVCFQTSSKSRSRFLPARPFTHNRPVNTLNVPVWPETGFDQHRSAARTAIPRPTQQDRQNHEQPACAIRSVAFSAHNANAIRLGCDLTIVPPGCPHRSCCARRR